MKVAKLILILLLVIGVGAALYWFAPQFFRPGGTIYLSLIPNNFSEPEAIYSFDPKFRSLKRILIDNKTPSHLINYSLSSDGRKAVFSLGVFDRDGIKEHYSQLFVSDSNGENRRPVTKSNSDKKNPVWSPDGTLIAFEATLNGERESDLVGRRVEQSGIFVTDLEGNERFITQGTQPHFSPDGDSVILLKNSGLYLANLESGQVERVWNMVGGLTYLGMKLDVSDDKRLLAWSSANVNDLMILDIESWKPFEAKVKDRYEVTGFWPRFSPDGKYLAFQEVDPETIRGQRLVIYKLSDGTKDTVLDLTDYYQESLWVNDWK